MELSGLDSMLMNFSAQSGGFWKLLNSGCYLIGAYFALLTGWELKNIHDSRGQKTYMTVIVTFLVAVVFMYMPDAMETFTTTMFDGVTNPPLSYSDGTSTTTMSGALGGIVRFVEMVGFVAFGRGWLILRSISEGRANEGASGRAITHMVGGILAVNILTFGPMLAKFVGINSMI